MHNIETLRGTDATRAMRVIAAHGRRIDVGLGWFRRGDARSADPVEHLGGGVGFWNCLRLYPVAGVGAVVMGNATSCDHGAIATRQPTRRPGRHR